MKKGERYSPRPSTLPKLAALMAYVTEYRKQAPLFRPPSTREMAAESKCSQAEIRRRLSILERQGKITWTPGVGRSVIPAPAKMTAEWVRRGENTGNIRIRYESATIAPILEAEVSPDSE